MYVGMTNDMSRRLCEHRNKIAEGFTKRYNISRLVCFEEYGHPQEAIDREKTLKGWTRERKNALVTQKNPDWCDSSHAFI